MKSVFLSTFLFAGAVLAQTVTPEVGSGAINALTQLNDKVPAAIPGAVLTVIIFVIEMSMRLFPTVKPRSLFIMIGKLFGLVGSLFLKLSALLDTLVQNLKEEK